MSELAQQLISQHEASLKSVNVERQIPPTIDQNLLTIYDDNIIVPDEGTTQSRARDAAQTLINNIWTQSAHETVEGDICAKLPVLQTNILLPREKPLPKEKAKTKWEQFAEAKGIAKRKKSRLEYDEETKEWVPRWGYKSKRSQKNREWAIEVPDHIDPNTDMFEKRAKEHKERVAKNEFQRLRNIARNSKNKKQNVDANVLTINPTGGGSKDELSKSFHLAKKTTASMGKFDEKVKGEKNMIERGRKRKFISNTDNADRDRMVKFAGEIAKGDKVLNAKKAAGRLIAGEQGVAGTGKKKEKEGQKKAKIGMKGKAQKAQRAGKHAKPGKKGGKR